MTCPSQLFWGLQTENLDTSFLNCISLLPGTCWQLFVDNLIGFVVLKSREICDNMPPTLTLFLSNFISTPTYLLVYLWYISYIALKNNMVLVNKVKLLAKSSNLRDHIVYPSRIKLGSVFLLIASYSIEILNQIIIYSTHGEHKRQLKINDTVLFISFQI